MYKLYFNIYIISIIIYLVIHINIFNAFKNINNFTCCLLNDILFYLNFIIYFLIVATLFKEQKGIYLVIGVTFILIRYVLINYHSDFFANYFGYKSIEYEADRVFYKLIDNDENILKNIYSKYGPLINNIEFKSSGVHDENTKTTFIQKILLDTGFIDKSETVKNYFSHILKLSTEQYKDEFKNIIKYLDRKYVVAKAIWGIILISILFCLSLKYI